MEFHISRAVREAAQVDDLLFSYSGNVVFANIAASRKLAAALNEVHSPKTEAASTYNAGALFAMGLIDELSHALIARYRKEVDPAILAEAINWFAAQSTPERLESLLLAFTQQFPNVAVFRNQITAEQWLTRSTEDIPNREVALEELLLLSLANNNPAFKPFAPLFEDKALKQSTVYPSVTAAFPDFFSTRPPLPAIGSLYEALLAPSLASPDSLTGQLEFIREHWSEHLGPELRRVLLAIDTLREEDVAIWMRFHPPGPDHHGHGAPTFGSQGFVGDEYIGFESEFGGEFYIAADGTRRRRYSTDYQAPLDEYEAFSADQAWMPNVVLMAKSTYVWLEQLSKKYGRHIHRLDHIPDEELRLLATRGITGLWLIGLWERSIASRTIKHLRGRPDAVASAYSLKSYDIAEDLGGWAAYIHLKAHAAAAGLRLASDMVPNHMGIDSPWVIDNPDWFIHRDESPFPAYSFNGPDLSTDPRVEIKLDDHYYDQTDAAVAFRLRHHADGRTRFVYHGNDGTTFAWNDTAQLDYSKANVREHVIQVILHVARLFPIIRFDAAMVLAKRHVQRLWFPLPGAGGSIPSRAEDAMSQEEFDAIMPHEFWREVVDRVAVEVPGTLLLAEAFWMLEGYFVRTLGMHRVYNSAFMNMLRDEENAKYRSYLKKTIEFDPDILKRYVNFMSNPDERTTVDQFGDGDKCFGVATLMSTLPGLPMFGHGQIEGFTERYGMEYKSAKFDEHPNEALVARHQREIAPLLKGRHIFAGSQHFLLYDFWDGYGNVNENVFAYSNRLDATSHSQRSFVIYNNKYEDTQGTVHTSAASMDKGSGQMQQHSIADGLGLPFDDTLILAYRDSARGLEYLRRATDIHHHGLTFSLHGFQCVVLLHWRELRATTEHPWDRLCDSLNGSGVASVEKELSRLRLRPVHSVLRDVLSYETVTTLIELAAETTRQLPPEVQPLQLSSRKLMKSGIAPRAHVAVPDLPSALASATTTDPRFTPIAEKSLIFFERTADLLPSPSPLAPPTLAPARSRIHPTDLIFVKPVKAAKPTPADSIPSLTRAAIRLPALTHASPATWPASAHHVLPLTNLQHHTTAPVLAWIVLSNLPATTRRLAAFDDLHLRTALAEIFFTMGLEGEAGWQAAARVRLLLSPATAAPNAILAESFWSDPDVRWLAGINHSAGATYFNKERFEELLAWLQLPALLAIAQHPSPNPQALAALHTTLATHLEAAEAAGYNLEAFLSEANAIPPAPTKEPALATSH